MLTNNSSSATNHKTSSSTTELEDNKLNKTTDNKTSLSVQKDMIISNSTTPTNHKLSPSTTELEPDNSSTTKDSQNQVTKELITDEPKWYRRVEVIGGAICIPLFVGVAGIAITISQFHTQQTQEKHTILKEYVDNIEALNLDKDLTENEKEVKQRDNKVQKTLEQTLETTPNTTKERLEILQSIKNAKDLSNISGDARIMAKGHTFTALRRLDGKFKGYLLRFLYESNLVKDERGVQDKPNNKQSNRESVEPVITLEGADINGVVVEDAWLWKIKLQGAYLRKANFINVNLNEANLTNAQLQEANLYKTYLQGANLQGANLQGANLQGADFQCVASKNNNPKDGNFQCANLQKTNFERANLQSTNFEGANLKEANFRGVKNLTIEQVKAAENWREADYDPEFREKLNLQ